MRLPLALAAALAACAPPEEAFEDDDLEALVLELEEADDIGDTRATAEPYWPRYGDVLDSPTDVDWFVVTNNGVSHPASLFHIMGTSPVRCAVYMEADLSPMATSVGNPCRVMFATTGTNRYYLKVWKYGTWVPTAFKFYFQY